MRGNDSNDRKRKWESQTIRNRAAQLDTAAWAAAMMDTRGWHSALESSSVLLSLPLSLVTRYFRCGRYSAQSSSSVGYRIFELGKTRRNPARPAPAHNPASRITHGSRTGSRITHSAGQLKQPRQAGMPRFVQRGTRPRYLFFFSVPRLSHATSPHWSKGVGRWVPVWRLSSALRCGCGDTVRTRRMPNGAAAEDSHPPVTVCITDPAVRMSGPNLQISGQTHPDPPRTAHLPAC